MRGGVHSPQRVIPHPQGGGVSQQLPAHYSYTLWRIALPSRTRAEPMMACIQLCLHTLALDVHFTGPFPSHLGDPHLYYELVDAVEGKFP